jgi:hypothetical protein
MSPATMKLPVVFSMLALGASSPISMIPRHIMPVKKGFTAARAGGGPARARRSWPLSARGEAPKAGAGLLVVMEGVGKRRFWTH